MNTAVSVSAWSHGSIANGDVRASDGRLLLRKIFALLLVLTMQTCYVKIVSLPLNLMLNGAVICVGFLCLLIERNAPIPRPLLGWTVIWCILFLSIPACHLLFLERGSVNFSALLLITVMCTVLFALCVCYTSIVGIRNVLDDVSKAIVLVTTISLILYFAGQVFGLVRPTGRVTIAWGGARTVDTYFFLLFVTQGTPYHSFAHGRFSGIYAEPPMCAFMICVALIIILFVSGKRLSSPSFAILLLGVYFTASMMGYIVTLVSVAVRLCLDVVSRRQLKSARALVVASVLIVVTTLALVMYEDKMTADVVSVTTRSTNFSGAVEDFLSSPIFGYGFKSDAVGITGGNTSVYSNLIQQGGALFLAWYMLPILLSVIRFVGASHWKLLAATILYLMLLYAAVVTYTALSVALVAVFFSVAFRGDASERVGSPFRGRSRALRRCVS